MTERCASPKPALAAKDIEIKRDLFRDWSRWTPALGLGAL